MDRIELYEKRTKDKTSVSNSFIDHYMLNANEVQLKVYLYLLRAAAGDEAISVSSIADRFNYPERDILRALSYWDKQGLITLDFDMDNKVRGICLNDDEKPPKDIKGEPIFYVSSVKKQDSLGSFAITQKNTRPFYPKERLQEFENREDVKGLVFATEQYMGHPLNSSDVTTILYMFDKLGFGVDLIEFLIEYCVNSGHKSMHYIEATALAWAEKGIRDLESAREEVKVFKKDYFAILKAYGISGRNPAQAEIDYMSRWKNEYGFSLDLIIEAVDRTMRSTAKPSFQYTESILKSWRDQNVEKLEDIEAIDKAYALKKKEPSKSKKSSSREGRPSHDNFKNFEERDYDFDALEKQFVKNL